jgi:hypothetical protein
MARLRYLSDPVTPANLAVWFLLENKPMNEAAAYFYTQFMGDQSTHRLIPQACPRWVYVYGWPVRARFYGPRTVARLLLAAEDKPMSRWKRYLFAWAVHEFGWCWQVQEDYGDGQTEEP